MSHEGAGGRGPMAPRSGRSGPRSRRLQRMLDEGPRTSGKTWVQLLLFVVILVLLFVSRDEIGRRAAGCYGVVEGRPLETPAAPAPSDAAGGVGTGVPATVRVERRPAPAAEPRRNATDSRGP